MTATLERLERAVDALKAWHEFWTERQESLLKRFERVTGRPLADACPTGCSCRGQKAVKTS